MRFKVDKYLVKEKGKTYSVLVFPFVKYMWVFNDWPEEDCYMVDGCVEAFSMLKYAMAILAEASDKIIYFPCKQEGMDECYRVNYNLILCTHKAQLCKSSWISIRRKLKSATYKGTYTLQYNRKKLDDFCTKNMLIKECNGLNEKYILNPVFGRKMINERQETMLGENVFMVLGKAECYYNHYRIAKDLDEYCASNEYGAWTAFGWIITSRGLEKMKKENSNVFG